MPASGTPRAFRRVLVIQGHPDAGARHLGHALADAYANGAELAGHAVARLEVARLAFPVLRSEDEWTHGTPAPDIARAQDEIRRADHLAVFFPLWMGEMPALLKAFLEQVARPGFALAAEGPGFPRRLLAGRSARIVVTMGMPAPVYRWVFRAHGLHAFERGMLRMAGIAPVRSTIVGSVARMPAPAAAHWLQQMDDLGRRGV